MNFFAGHWMNLSVLASKDQDQAEAGEKGHLKQKTQWLWSYMISIYTRLVLKTFSGGQVQL